MEILISRDFLIKEGLNKNKNETAPVKTHIILSLSQTINLTKVLD